MSTKNEKETVEQKVEMTAEQRDAAIAQAIVDLREAKGDRGAQKNIRAKLRRLGHVGGLRAIDGAKGDDAKDAKVVEKAKVGKKKAKKAKKVDAIA